MISNDMEFEVVLRNKKKENGSEKWNWNANRRSENKTERDAVCKNVPLTPWIVCARVAFGIQYDKAENEWLDEWMNQPNRTVWLIDWNNIDNDNNKCNHTCGRLCQVFVRHVTLARYAHTYIHKTFQQRGHIHATKHCTRSKNVTHSHITGASPAAAVASPNPNEKSTQNQNRPSPCDEKGRKCDKLLVVRSLYVRDLFSYLRVHTYVWLKLTVRIDVEERIVYFARWPTV